LINNIYLNEIIKYFGSKKRNCSFTYHRNRQKANLFIAKFLYKTLTGIFAKNLFLALANAL